MEALKLNQLRGEEEGSADFLACLSSPDGLLFAADHQARAGRFAVALTLVERALSQCIDMPGALERQRRYLRKLGRDVPEKFSDHATVMHRAPPEVTLSIVREAGRGGAGVIYQAIDETLGRDVALKVYHRRDTEQLLREARVPGILAGRGVIRVFDVDADGGWLALEWLREGSLMQRLVVDPQALFPVGPWFSRFVETLDRVHRAGWVHADLKPANLLFRFPGEPVLGDFGLSRREGERARGGYPGYLSPERVSGAALSFGDDVYALGRILEETLAGLAGCEVFCQESQNLSADR